MRQLHTPFTKQKRYWLHRPHLSRRFQLYFAEFHDQTDLLLSQLCDMGVITSEDYAMVRFYIECVQLTLRRSRLFGLSSLLFHHQLLRLVSLQPKCHMPSLLQHVLFDAIPLALVRCLESEVENIISFVCGNEEQQAVRALAFSLQFQLCVRVVIETKKLW